MGTDIAQWLREIARQLITCTIEDGAIEAAKLIEAADEIDRLRQYEPSPHPGGIGFPV